MNRIRLLPEQVANQIAAGEVIERPASIVKELVENALDAQATHVIVEIQAGGRSLVRVTDDGVGMSRDDALLCLERHATSKIERAEDLAAIATLGFRGEALPSIASVSRFTLTTRERDGESPEGTRVVVHGGRILEVKTAGHAPGTSLDVRQLFYNLPARRKFLRSEDTERAHIQHYLTLAALACPEVGFALTHDQRRIWQLPPARAGSDRAAAVRDRLRALLGPDLHLLPVDHRAELPETEETEDEFREAASAAGLPSLRVWGFIGAPGVSRATRQDQHLFVNRRPIENRALNFALLEGYHTALMKGRYPVACLFLDIDPAEVDVNVHPAKREVKFRHEQLVRQHVTQAVRQALVRFHTAPSPPSREPDRPRAGVPAAAPPSFSRIDPVAAPGSRILTIPASPSSPPAVSPLPAGSATGTLATDPGVPLLQVPLRLAGVLANLYVLLESDRGLVLMDQHAAHERILYEQMLQRMEAGPAPSQRLLLPETVELSPRDAQFLRENLAVLTRLGVGLSEFGERTFLLDALPPFVKVADARRFVLELVDQLVATGREVNSLRLGEHVVAKTVCRHAVKANDALAGPELENLVEDLRHCVMPYTCPHGRPTLIELSYREMERRFGRSA
jgi:DNA mismatch repair protein MutL